MKDLRTSMAMVIILLISVGIVMIYSSSGVYALQVFGNKIDRINYYLFVGYIIVYAVSFIIGLLGFAKFPITQKILDTGWIKFDEIYKRVEAKAYGARLASNKFSGLVRQWLGLTPDWRYDLKDKTLYESRLILWSTVVGAIISTILIIMPDSLAHGVDLKTWLWAVPQYGLPMIAAFCTWVTVRVDHVREKKVLRVFQELFPEDLSKISREKLSILFNISLLPPIFGSIFIWRSAGLLWSAFYMGVPFASLYALIYAQPILDLKIMKYRVPKLAILGLIGGTAAILTSISAWGLLTAWLIAVVYVEIIYKPLRKYVLPFGTPEFEQKMKQTLLTDRKLEEGMEPFRQVYAFSKEIAAMETDLGSDNAKSAELASLEKSHLLLRSSEELASIASDRGVALNQLKPSDKYRTAPEAITAFSESIDLRTALAQKSTADRERIVHLVQRHFDIDLTS